MTKPNFRPLVKTYVLSVLADHEHNINQPTNDQLFQYAKDRFFSEYGYLVRKIGLQPAIREWLLGLALNIDYTYYDIGLRLKEWGVLSGNETDREREKALDQYWNRIAVCLASEFKN
jgi:hypothetical protein